MNDMSTTIQTNQTQQDPAASDELNVAMLLPDGRGVRNFILGPFVDEMRGQGRIHALHVIPEDHLDQYRSMTDESVQWHPLLMYRDSATSFLLRNCLSYSQMYWVDSFAMRYRRNQPIMASSFRRRTATRLAKAVGKMTASPRRIKMLDNLHSRATRRMPIVEHYRNLFREIRPNVLFCSHQRPTEILPPVLAARDLGIPTATFIFSWDNLTSKGRIAAPFDHFLVWSEHMKGEILRYYPDVAADRIHVVGTPQFDPYADETLVKSREDFFTQLGADPARPLLCYSCGSYDNTPQDPQHAAILMEQIRSGQINGNPQVVLRPCPTDDGGRYVWVKEKYDEIIMNVPEWTQEDNWAACVPTQADVEMMVNLMRHCDLNINFASTMTLDFAIHDKPVVNVAFDACDPPTFGMTLWEYQNQFEHYQPVVEMNVARFAKSADEMAEHVNTYLEHPELEREGRRRFVEMQVGQPIGSSSAKIVQVLSHLVQQKSQ